MTEPTRRIAAIIDKHRLRTDYNHPAYGLCRCGFDPNGWDENDIDNDYGVHVADEIVKAFMSWDFLMELLDTYYPEDVFPTADDRLDRDPGPRIVSLIRVVDRLRKAQTDA